MKDRKQVSAHVLQDIVESTAASWQAEHDLAVKQTHAQAAPELSERLLGQIERQATLKANVKTRRNEHLGQMQEHASKTLASGAVGAAAIMLAPMAAGVHVMLSSAVIAIAAIALIVALYQLVRTVDKGRDAYLEGRDHIEAMKLPLQAVKEEIEARAVSKEADLHLNKTMSDSMRQSKHARDEVAEMLPEASANVRAKLDEVLSTSGTTKPNDTPERDDIASSRHRD